MATIGVNGSDGASMSGTRGIAALGPAFMDAQRAAYTGAAQLFDYPSPAAAATAGGLLSSPPAWLEAASPEMRTLVEQFARAVTALPLGRWEELYTQTFDLQPDLTLNMGHQLFGEDWKRSSLLIELQAIMPRYGIDCGTELPDYLPHLLRLLAARPIPPALTAERDESVDEGADVRDLRAEVVLPALRALSAKLAADNPYTPLLQALTLLLMEPATQAIP